jgi:hypothetical protein
VSRAAALVRFMLWLFPFSNMQQYGGGVSGGGCWLYGLHWGRHWRALARCAVGWHQVRDLALASSMWTLATLQVAPAQLVEGGGSDEVHPAACAVGSSAETPMVQVDPSRNATLQCVGSAERGGVRIGAAPTLGDLGSFALRNSQESMAGSNSTFVLLAFRAVLPAIATSMAITECCPACRRGILRVCAACVHVSASHSICSFYACWPPGSRLASSVELRLQVLKSCLAEWHEHRPQAVLHRLPPTLRSP